MKGLLKIALIVGGIILIAGGSAFGIAGGVVVLIAGIAL